MNDATKHPDLTEIRYLIGDEDAGLVNQGIAMLNAATPALWALLAEGCSLEPSGRIHISEASEIHKQVRPGFRDIVAVHALAATGKLDNPESLALYDCCSLESLAGIKDLGELHTLRLRAGWRGYIWMKGEVSPEPGTWFVDLAGIEHLPNLQELDLAHCMSLESLAGIEHLTNLKKLDLHECNSLETFEGIDNLTSLQELDLSKETGKYDSYFESSFVSIPNLNLPSLKKLDLGGNYELASLAGVEKLTSLEELNLDCSSPESLAGIEKLTSLRSLNLRFCESLESLSVIKDLKNLRDLNLEGCDSLESLAGIENFKHLSSILLPEHLET